MSVIVELTYGMSRVLGVSRFELEDPSTVKDLIQMTRERFVSAGEEFEELSRGTVVAVNGVLISYRKGLKTPLCSGDRVAFVKAAAGG